MRFEIPMFFYIVMFALGIGFFVLCYKALDVEENGKKQLVIISAFLFVYVLSFVIGFIPDFCQQPLIPDVRLMHPIEASAALGTYNAELFAFSIVKSIGRLSSAFADGISSIFTVLIIASYFVKDNSDKKDSTTNKEKEVSPPTTGN